MLAGRQLFPCREMASPVTSECTDNGCHTWHQPLPGKYNAFSLLRPDVGLAAVHTGGVAPVATLAKGMVPSSLAARPYAMLLPQQPVQHSFRTPPDVANLMVTRGISSVQDEQCPRLIEINARY